MSDIEKIIDVTLNVQDWGALGRYFADQTSPDQAEFLQGFYEACYDKQLAFIGGETLFNVNGREEVAQFFADLAYYIRGTGE